MIVQPCIVPLTFSKKENGGSSVLIEPFLKEAIEILRHADESFLPVNDKEEVTLQQQQQQEEEEDNQAITWKLNLTPTSMTLDTNILTLSGLEKVLERTRINVKPVPPKHKERSLIDSNQFNMSLFQQIMQQVLQLSSAITIPRSEMLQQYNSMQIMKLCVHSFIECGYSFFLDVPSLVANTDMILSHPSAAKEHTVETLLILSICSLMVRHTMQQHQNGDAAAAANTLMYNYYGQARQLLQDLFDVHHISVVQSMYILSIYPQGHTHLLSPLKSKSPLLDTATRMAMAMDLHKLNIQRNEESDQKERLRRLAWMLFCADYFSNWNASEQTGLIDVKEWHVDFPQPLPSEGSKRQVELFSQYCRIVLLRKLNLFRTSVMISFESGQLESVNLDDQLIQSYFNTPDAFKLNMENQVFTSKSDLESLLLYELYCHTQITAYLPFLPQYYFKQFVAEDESTRLQDLNEIYQHFAKRRQPIQPVNIDLLEENNNYNNINTTISSASLSKSSIKINENYCLAKILKSLNMYTLFLESLTSLDPKGCSHNPVYGLVLTTQLYLIIIKRCQLPEIRSVCQINLIRSLRVIRQVRAIYADPAILYIERMLSRYNVMTKDEITVCTLSQRSNQIINVIFSKFNISTLDVKQEPPPS